MVSARKKKRQNKKHFDQLDETLNDYVIGNGITVSTLVSETLEPQAKGRLEKFENFVDSASQNKVIGSNTDERIIDAFDTAVIAVENACMTRFWQR